jgi:hypothetical protein
VGHSVRGACSAPWPPGKTAKSTDAFGWEYARYRLGVVGVSESCDDCGTSVSDALARTVRVSVDRSQVDSQRLCPSCFADWIDRYRERMQPDQSPVEPNDDDIIVD